VVPSFGTLPAQVGFFAGNYWLTFAIGGVAAQIVARQLGPYKLVLAGLAGALWARSC
jgi:hypothetical protein